MTDRTPSRSDPLEFPSPSAEDPDITDAEDPPVEPDNGHPGDRRDRNMDALLRAFRKTLAKKRE